MKHLKKFNEQIEATEDEIFFNNLFDDIIDSLYTRNGGGLDKESFKRGVVSVINKLNSEHDLIELQSMLSDPEVWHHNVD